MNIFCADNINCFKEFGALLQPYTIPAPECKKNIIEIEGADGELDLSTVLTDGRVLYKNRNFDLSFAFINGKIADDFVNFLHGKKRKFTFSDDPDYYWNGFFEWDGTEKQKGRQIAKFKIDTEPFKQYVELTHFTKLTEDGMLIKLPNDRMWTNLTIIAEENCSISFHDVVYFLKEGRQEFEDLILRDGENVIKCNDQTKLKFEYRQGRL